MRLLLSFSISLLLGFILIKLSSFLKIYDHPDNKLKPHGKPVPYLGGISFLIASLVISPLSLFCVLLLFTVSFIGFLDDVFSLSPVIRLTSLAGISLVFSIISIDGFHVFPLVLSVFGLLILTNIINWSDGMDGILAGKAILNFLGLYFILKSLEPSVAGFYIILSSALVGYLIWNFYPAKIYMGDGGSYFIGAAIYLSFTSLLKTWNFLFLISLGFNLSLYIIDGAFAFIRRVITGRNVLLGDRDHYYDKIFRRIKGELKKRNRATALYSYMLNALYVIFSFAFVRFSKYYLYLTVIWVILTVIMIMKLRLFEYDRK